MFFVFGLVKYVYLVFIKKIWEMYKFGNIYKMFIFIESEIFEVGRWSGVGFIE